MTPKGQRIRRRRGPRPVKRRFADRFKAGLRSVGLLALLLFTVVGVSYAALRGHDFAQNSEFFRLHAIEVAGVSPEIETEMRALMDDIEVGERTLFNVSPRVIQTRLEQHPHLEPRLLSVSRQWPDRLVVNATERVPVATVAGQRLMLVTSEGWLIEQNPSRVMERDMPLLTGIPESALTFGERIEDPDADALLEWLLAIRHHTPRVHRRLSEIHIDEAGEVTVHLIGGARIHLGTRGPLEQMPVLLSFMRQNRRKVGEDLRGVSLLDMRMENHLVYRPTGV